MKSSFEMVTGDNFDPIEVEKQLYSVVYPPNVAETVVWVGGNIPDLDMVVNMRKMVWSSEQAGSLKIQVSSLPSPISLLLLPLLA